MPHPIYGPPSHRLARIEVRVDLPDQHNNFVTSALVTGISDGKRAPLFTMAAHWDPDDVEHGLQVADWVNHAVLAFLQDRPASQEKADQSLRGEGWEEVSLPF